MKTKAPERKPYAAPQLIEYGNLGRLIRTNEAGTGVFDGMASKTVVYKTG